MSAIEHLGISPVVLAISPNIDYQDEAKELTADNFITRQNTDLLLGEFRSTQGSEYATKVVVKVLRRVPTQEFINRLGAILDACRQLESRYVPSAHGLMFVGRLVAIVTPYYSNGNVIDYLGRLGDSSTAHVPLLIRELVVAVVHLHAHEVVHGNIHSENVMIDDAGHVVLSDIGIDAARNASEYQQRVPAKYRYKAPEILIPTGSNTVAGPTMEGDIYSLALTIEELYTRLPPFHHIKSVYTFIAMMDGSMLSNHVPNVAHMPAEIRDLVGDCCRDTPGMRLTAEECLNRLPRMG